MMIHVLSYKTINHFFLYLLIHLKSINSYFFIRKIAMESRYLFFLFFLLFCIIFYLLLELISYISYISEF